MSERYHHLLEIAHYRTGLLVKLGNRLLLAIFLMGGLFCVMSVMLIHFLNRPEAVLHLHAFAFNYSDFVQAEEGRVVSHREMFSSQENARRDFSHDPNWDGAIAGASLGLAVGRDVPVVGLVFGPVIGAMVGYQLDTRI
jgi:hypothetical protein